MRGIRIRLIVVCGLGRARGMEWMSFMSKCLNPGIDQEANFLEVHIMLGRRRKGYCKF
jgi:hypothetical protein